MIYGTYIADPVDPVRRRVLQGAFSAALGLTLPGRKDRIGVARRPLEAHVHVNQLGYLPSEPKRAVVAASDAVPGGSFTIVDERAPHAVRYLGSLREYRTGDGEPYGQYARHYFADFDRFARPGRYRVGLSNGKLSAPFTIAADLYRRLTPLVAGYFDIQRCGDQTHPARNRCHMDDGVISGGPRDGQPFDAMGGWHDAGDFLKFTVTTSYVTALLLFAHEHLPAPPKSGKAQAEEGSLLPQARVGLEWLLKMHPSPEELYFQVGDESDHDEWRLPEEDTPRRNCAWRPRTVAFGAGANLAGRCAAAFAMASRHYRQDDPAFAARCRRAAVSVYALGMENQNVQTTQPASFYPETTWLDDMEWGAVEIYRATGSPFYLDQALDFSRAAGPAAAEASVYNTHALAHYTLWRQAPRQERDRLLDYLRSDADLARSRSRNPYGLATPYTWGTTAAAAGSALTCLLYSALSRDRGYRDIARHQRDFILGCNPFGESCVIGVGTRFPQYPHHQIANIADIELTGAVVGGPASRSIFQEEAISLNEPSLENMTIGPVPADDPDDEVAVYHDSAQDYVTNEPANDYTATFLALNVLSQVERARV
jgi:hypothetical protein